MTVSGVSGSDLIGAVPMPQMLKPARTRLQHEMKPNQLEGRVV